MSYHRSICVGAALVLSSILVSLITFFISLGPCPTGSFPCDNGTVCVPQRAICDNHVDCEDGQDEDAVECGDFHGSNELIFMIGSSNRTARHFSKNYTNVANTTNNNACVLDVFPEGCICAVADLYCSRLGLITVPQVSPLCNKLVLSSNSITLHSDDFKSLELDFIGLRNNSLVSLPPDAFLGQSSLRRLYLNQNRLEILPKGIFQGLESLIWLFLDDNLLQDGYLNEMSGLNNLLWLNMSGNKLTLRGEQFPDLPKIHDLYLDDNSIPEIENDVFSNLGNLEMLSLENNKILQIHENAFLGLSNLRELRLANNRLTALPENIFFQSSKLDALFLGYNNVIIDRTFLVLKNLSYLNIEGVDMQMIDFETIAGMHSLELIYFKKFYYCSYVPNIKKCRPVTDGVSSLQDLLSKPALRYSAWIVAAVTCLGNVFVLCFRFTFRDENRSLSVLIRNLAVSDGLMGVYLTVLGAQDARYRSVYHEAAHDWVTSWSCTALGALAMLSSEVSMLILAFISVERFLLIANPWGGRRQLPAHRVAMVLFSIWLLGAALAVIPVIHWRSSTRFYGTYSGTCFPLHLQERFPLGWQYSAFIFLGINFTGLILIGVAYAALLSSILRTRRSTPLTVMDCDFAIRFFFIVLIDALCWGPIIALKIFAFMSFEISADLYAWLVVCVLPLNSAVNPFLYTFTSPRYKDRLLVRMGLVSNTTDRDVCKATRGAGHPWMRWLYGLFGRCGPTWMDTKRGYAQTRLSVGDTESSRVHPPCGLRACSGAHLKDLTILKTVDSFKDCDL